MKRAVYFLLFALPVFVFGQQEYNAGYIKTSPTDSIFGWVDMNIRTDNFVRFKTEKEIGDVQYFFPDKFIEAKVGDKYVKSITIKNKEGEERKVLAWRLVSGKINLFIGYEEKMGELFFINREGHEELRAINKHGPKAFMKGYFKDCPKDVKVSFDYESLYEAIQQ